MSENFWALQTITGGLLKLHSSGQTNKYVDIEGCKVAVGSKATESI